MRSSRRMLQSEMRQNVAEGAFDASFVFVNRRNGAPELPNACGRATRCRPCSECRERAVSVTARRLGLIRSQSQPFANSVCASRLSRCVRLLRLHAAVPGDSDANYWMDCVV